VGMVLRANRATVPRLVVVPNYGTEALKQLREGVRTFSVGIGVVGAFPLGGVAALGARDRVALVDIAGVVIAVRRRR